MIPEIGIPEEQVQSITKNLASILTSEFELYIKTLHAHWNVVDRSFYGLHKMFGKQYEEISGIVDSVAERIRSLGGLADVSGNYIAKINKLSGDILPDLLEAHEVLITELREYIKEVNQTEDFGTANFLTGIMEQHEKMAWMLRASFGKQ
jgi:starvation-inducible DNA-binding protein